MPQELAHDIPGEKSAVVGSLSRKRADGSISYTAIVRIKKPNQPLHQESKTFSLRSKTKAWARRRSTTQPPLTPEIEAWELSPGEFIDAILTPRAWESASD